MGSERIFLWVCRGSLEFFFLLWVGFGVLLQNLCKPNVKANRKVAQPTWGFGRSFDWFTRLTLTAAHFISRHNQDHTKAKKKKKLEMPKKFDIPHAGNQCTALPRSASLDWSWACRFQPEGTHTRLVCIRAGDVVVDVVLVPVTFPLVEAARLLCRESG